jgi:hypothetical protein
MFPFTPFLRFTLSMGGVAGRLVASVAESVAESVAGAGGLLVR